MTAIHPLLSLALVLSAGLVGGELISRLKLPRVTGWIITGILLRAFAVPGARPADLVGFSPLTDFVLGYIAFTVGSHLNLRQLRNAGKRLLFLVATEATIVPAMVILTMHGIAGLPLGVSMIFAAVAVAGAPGTTVLVVREARARGVFVKTLVAAVALIDMIAVSLFVLVESELRTGLPIEGPAFLITSFPSVMTTLLLAAGVGLGSALLVMLLARAVIGTKLLGASMVGAILLAWGFAALVGASSILACTFVGMSLGNLMKDKERAGEAYLDPLGDILFTVFYTLAGIRLDFSTVPAMAGFVALYFGGRAVGKVASSWLAMTAAGAIRSTRRYLGLALIPHGGVAVGLLLFVESQPYFAEWSAMILTVGLAALAINQLVGPSATKFALTAAGEAGFDRPRLLDFLREQDIVTGMRAESREDAIRQLVDLLYRTHSLSTPKEEYLARVIQRDQAESTCLGEGLMIPHGNVADSEDDVVGVMGISAAGLPFATPDDRPVQAIVLLATPSGQRDRHLEVLAAFAKAIGGDRNVREQLYRASSPAHAYGILHAESAEVFNYFLEDSLNDDLART